MAKHFERRYAVRVYYAGDNYHGSQIQPNVPTIEGELIKALLETRYITDSNTCELQFASRTDANVMARMNVFTVKVVRELHLMELNQVLPRDIILWAATEVPASFSPRYDAIGREYRYFYPFDPLNRHKLDLTRIKEALPQFLGTHDYAGFTKESEEQYTIRTITEASMNEVEGGIWFLFGSKAFLYHQIRKMVQCLINIGHGKWEAEMIQKIFQKPQLAVENNLRMADPRGLILWAIKYPPDKTFKFISGRNIQKTIDKYFSKICVDAQRKFHVNNSLLHNLQNQEDHSS